MEQMFFNYNPHLKYLVNHTERHSEALHKEQKKATPTANSSKPSKNMEATPDSTLPQKNTPEFDGGNKAELENKISYIEKRIKEELDIIEKTRGRKKRGGGRKKRDGRKEKTKAGKKDKKQADLKSTETEEYLESLFELDENFIIVDELIKTSLAKDKTENEKINEKIKDEFSSDQIARWLYQKNKEEL